MEELAGLVGLVGLMACLLLSTSLQPKILFSYFFYIK